MGGNTLASSCLYISATLPATEDEAGYAALTWTKIGEITNFGSRGDSYNDSTSTPICTGRVEHYKGAVDGGSASYTMNWDKDDAGQVIVSAARDSFDNYAFKEEWQGGDGEYFSGRVLGRPHDGGDANAIQSNTLNIAVNTAAVPFDAP